jgi:hypothetical protein
MPKTALLVALMDSAKQFGRNDLRSKSNWAKRFDSIWQNGVVIRFGKTIPCGKMIQNRH